MTMKVLTTLVALISAVSAFTSPAFLGKSLVTGYVTSTVVKCAPGIADNKMKMVGIISDEIYQIVPCFSSSSGFRDCRHV